MPRAAKKSGESAPPPPKKAEEADPLEELQKAVQAARAERMRAERDLELLRLELAEQQRRSSQQALVASEALKEARRDRDNLRMQVDALRAEHVPSEVAPRRKREMKDDGERVHSLEESLAAAQAELVEARTRLSAAETQLANQRAEHAREISEVRAALAAEQAAHAQARSALDDARSKPPPAVAPSAPPPSAPPAVPAAEAPAQPQKGFFGKLFGKK